jgi:hypothetical protein
MYSTFMREGIWPQIFGADRLGAMPADCFVVLMRQRRALNRARQIPNLMRRRDFSEHQWNRQHRRPLATYEHKRYNGHEFSGRQRRSFC